MMPRTISRRALLRGTLAAAAATPLFGSLGSRQANGSPTTPPRRLVVVYTPTGQLAQHWPTVGNGADFELPEALSALEPHRHALQFLTGCHGSSGHYEGHAEVLTGQPQIGQESFSPAGGPSLDQLIAELHKGATALPSLELGVGVANGASDVISYSTSGLAIPTLNTVAAGFQRVFGSGAALPADLAASVRSVDVQVTKRLQRQVQAAAQPMSQAEKLLLDEHSRLLADREASLVSPAPVADCNATMPATADDFPGTVSGHIDTIVQALACDATRVASLIVGGSGATTHYDWAGAPVDYHEAAHGNVADAAGNMGRIMAWHAEQVAALLAGLDSIAEGDGTVLDNTVVLWTSELGVHDFSHSKDHAAVMIAGGASAGLATGRIVDAQGQHYHDVLLTLAHVLGRTDLSGFGLHGSELCEELLA